MNFRATALTERRLFRDSFEIGWERFSLTGTEESYFRDPVAMARTVFDHGGDCHQMPAAACLAGPALFSSAPDPRLHPRLLLLGREILRATDPVIVPVLSADARLFLQVSAMQVMEKLADERTPPQRECLQALDFYAAARGDQDAYRLDGRFAAVARKIQKNLD